MLELQNLLNNNESYNYTITHHCKPIVIVKFNRDGDLIFTASKGNEIIVCNLLGEAISVLGDFNGAITNLAIQKDSSSIAGSSADQTVYIFDTQTEKEIKKLKIKTIAKHLHYSLRNNELLITCDNSYKLNQEILIMDERSKEYSFSFVPENIPTSSLIDLNEEKIVFSDELGNISLIDRRNNKIILEEEIHGNRINNLKPSFCNTFFTSSSNDMTCKIIDFDDLSVIKSFMYSGPVNDASIFPSNNILVSVGGISAREAALSGGKMNFLVSFFDIVSQKLIGNYQPHFGTVNTVDVHPSSKMFCSGGEDANICLLKFGPDFYEAGFTEID